MDRWTGRTIAIGTIALVVLGSLLVLLWVQQNGVTDRLTHDEHASCLIQAHGLPAAKQQVAVMRDLHAVLTFRPVTRQQRLAQRREPMKLRLIIRDLNRHLAAYTREQRLVPGSRSC